MTKTQPNEVGFIRLNRTYPKSKILTNPNMVGFDIPIYCDDDKEPVIDGDKEPVIVEGRYKKYIFPI